MLSLKLSLLLSFLSLVVLLVTLTQSYTRFKDCWAKAALGSNNVILVIYSIIFVVALQAHDVGRLMGLGGRRIRRISQDTGCRIVVGKNVPPGETVPIDVYAEHQSELTEAIKLITKCFEDDEDGPETDEEGDHDSAESDSDAEDSSTVRSDSALSQRKLAAEAKPRPHYGLKQTYSVSADMVRVLVLEKLAARGGEEVLGFLRGRQWGSGDTASWH